ncbi:MAG: tetratricopeptide repeat protein [Acidobacteria bacterium]|nr:tetratricopeptide repeat protein [Acidobacteriota bacterium]
MKSRNHARATTKLLLLLAAAACLSACLIFVARRAAAAGEERGPGVESHAGDEVERLIDSALFTRAEFFGAEARVPFPTAEARNRVAALREQRPSEPRVTLALARLDEKLGRYDLAEGEFGQYASASGESYEALEELAAFQHRRALFAKEAATLEALLRAAPDGAREQLLERLVRLAEVQKLDAYLKPEFFERVIEERPNAFRIVAGYIDRLDSQKSHDAALEALHRYKPHFPARRRYFLDKEVSLLEAAGRAREAESIYLDAFDPFWPDDLSEQFYEFLREHDRYRAYGQELRQAFRRDPSDFKAATRLFHFRKHAYEETDRIFARLEAARAARGVRWEPEELGAVARLLVKEGDADTASRFLYTLVARGGLEKGTPARARVLYQLFELLSDAGGERLALTRGDLQFYRDVAASDPHPGLVGGVLSLIFSDTDPSGELESEDEEAVKFFNRAAAYRIFNAYKEENPTSPELAQMYLDVVRLYTAAKEPQVAEAALAEFEQRYGDAPRYAEVALKLADCYVLLGRHEEERAIYRRALDHLGNRRDAGRPLVPSEQTSASLSEPTETRPTLAAYPPKSNPGIKADEEEKAAPYSYYERSSSYRDFMASEERWQHSEGDEAQSDEASTAAEESEDEGTVSNVKVTYSDVLARYAASLASENKTGDILALYAGEIKKYPDEQGLYEQLLQWLGQTNLFDEQSRVYKEALERFPNEVWRDRLARWMLRRERRDEFENFSRELISKLDDREAEGYLEKFVAAGAGANASFESNLYLGLYRLAHERFPHDLRLVQGLLKFYAAHDRRDEYRQLLAEYYFVSPEIREQFLAHLAERGELRARLDDARNVLKGGDDAEATVAPLPYKLFRADASARLSNYEEAVDAYRELNRLYPQTPEFAERLIAFTRSLGQHTRKFLEEASAVSRSLADAQPADAAHRTRAGEILAELGEYERARAEWAQLITSAPGEPDSYLEAATVNWDYFQYADALAIINRLRRETGDRATYAFEAGAILEALHKPDAAVAEYVKALDADAAGHARARRRLGVLLKRKGVPALVAASYARERTESANGAHVAVGYAELLRDAGRREEASKLLSGEVARSDDEDFIETARGIFSENEEAEGERACLFRLIKVSRSPRHVISYSLRLAEAYGQGERESAAAVLRGLVRQFPVNYGVLREASSSYRRLGFAEESLQVLRGAAARARGHYRRDFARRLAARLLELQRPDEARRVLEGLHAEDPLDLGVFRELARVYVRTDAADALKAAFGETLKAVRATDAAPREMRTQVADLRRAMVGAFTQLRDYRAAMEQHVEIVNRDPDDDENVEAAIAYAKRYGGADALLAYYQKTAAQAYKNYRWDVVLARIYEAKGDLSSAARSYKGAIANQPEMVELHAALAEIDVKAGDYDGALGALGRAAELSNDDPQYLRRTAEVLEKAGRAREAAEVRKRLPGAEAPKRESTRDLFNNAAAKLSADRAQAVEEYRRAFEAMAADPYGHDLRASEVTGYVAAVRDVEGLDRIFERLWQLREKLIAEANLKESQNAGKARALVGTLDGALPEAVGALAAQQATGDELAALFESLRKKTDDSLRAPDAYGTLALLQNLGHRAGFAALEERILTGQKDAARASGESQTFHSRLRALASFYASGGEYARAAELLEAEARTDAARDDFEYASLTAEYARLAGDGARELNALRSYYDRRKVGTASQTDPLVERYLSLLAESGQAGRDELRRRAQEPSQYNIQLINFLIAKDESELAHEAIESAASASPWKLARNAQVSLALREFDGRGANYFDAALRPATIGELVGRKDAGAEPLSGDEWSRLEESYGRWLYLSGGDVNRAKSRAALPAVVESRPHDAGAQAELGRWYLAQGDATRAVEHLSLAHEESADDARTIADLGSAYFLAGERDRAEALWAQLVCGGELSSDSCVLYLKTLARHGLAAEARERLLPVVSKRLKEAGYFYESNEEFAEAKKLVVALAQSFGGAGDDSQTPLSKSDEEARAAYMRKLCEAAPDETELPRIMVEEKLVGRAQRGEFYALLVERTSGLSSYEHDYEFVEFTQNTFGVEDVDEAFDHANSFKVSEPDAKRIDWQKQYLQYLLEEGRNAEAEKLIPSIEKEIERRYARPAWLRLAKVRLELRGGRGERAVAELKRYAGADVSADLSTVSAPSAERLSESVALLRAEGYDAGVPQLLEAAYTQSLALGQYETPSFVGLARLAFERGDAARGEKLLRLMVALAGDETRDDAAAEVAALPEVGRRFAALARIEVPEPSNRVERDEALRLASETAAAFGRFALAAELRTRLSGEKPDDYANRVELARVLAAGGRSEEAVAQLASIISDRHAPRAIRWQSVWVAPEVTDGRQELWASLSKTSDEEMAAALRARELTAEGRAAEAADLLKRAAETGANPMLEFFFGVAAEKAGRAAEAAEAFTSALRSQADEELSTAFGADEETALRKLIRLHVSAGRPLAALQLASLDKELGSSTLEDVNVSDNEETNDAASTNGAAQPSSSGFRTLKERAEARGAASVSELLGLLSAAAERVKEFDKAIEFERSRLGRLAGAADRRASRERVTRLVALQRDEAEARGPVLVVDSSTVAQN